MEISAFWIYLIGTLGSIKSSLDFLTFMFFALTFGSGFFLVMTYYQYSLSQEKKNTITKWLKRILITSSLSWFLLGLISTFLPTPKTVVAMITVPAIVNNEEVQKLPKNILSFVNEYLEQNIYKYKNQEEENDL